jgi:hypothetical protein
LASGEGGSHVHLLESVSQGLSTDGTTAMMVFMVGGGTEDAPPRKFAITFPVEKAKWLLGLVYEVVQAAEKIGHKSGSLFHFPMEWGVGCAPELDTQAFKLADNASVMPVGGKVVVSFDLGKPSEASYVMMNLSGLGLAQTLTGNIMSRLTDEERQHLAAARVKVNSTSGEALLLKPPSTRH